MNVVDAAASGGDSVLVLSLSVAGVVIVLLVAVLAWLLKDRLRARQRYEELLEKRLSSGSETMHQLRIQIEQMQATFLEQLAQMASNDKVDDYIKTHSEKHDTIDRRFDNMKDIHHELSERMTALTQKVETGLESMTKMLGQILEVKGCEA